VDWGCGLGLWTVTAERDQRRPCALCQFPVLCDFFHLSFFSKSKSREGLQDCRIAGLLGRHRSSSRIYFNQTPQLRKIEINHLATLGWLAVAGCCWLLLPICPGPLR
jgi:hypothetical protein